jgi:hypothetical protein
MSEKAPNIKIEYELCKTCNGSGRNYSFSHFGSTKPNLKERLCRECYGMGKRPIPLETNDPNIKAVAVSVPEGADPKVKESVKAALEKIGAARELTPEETAEIFTQKHNPLGPYADYEEMSVEDVSTLGISDIARHVDDVPAEKADATNKVDPAAD